MLTSISPLGERARGNRWARTATAYVAGSTLGGLTIGSALGGLGALHPLPLLVAGALGAVALGAELAGRVPTVHRQVDEDWLTRYRGWVYGLGYGAQLGVGVVTIVTSAATYLALALCLLSGSLLSGAAIGGVFGLVRALPLLLLRGADSPAALHRAATRLDRLAGWSRQATTGTLVAATALLLAAA
jgi:hypothetical protein